MKHKPGQTLIFLMIFMALSIIITSAAVILIIINSQGANKYEQGTVAYGVAESGAENALMRLLRDPSYSGETLTIGNSAATISVTGSNPKTILSIGTFGNFQRRVEVTLAYVNGVLTVTSWREIY